MTVFLIFLCLFDLCSGYCADDWKSSVEFKLSVWPYYGVISLTLMELMQTWKSLDFFFTIQGFITYRAYKVCLFIKILLCFFHISFILHIQKCQEQNTNPNQLQHWWACRIWNWIVWGLQTWRKIKYQPFSLKYT